MEHKFFTNKYINIFIFIFIFMAIFVSQNKEIFNLNLEIGDFAANSLLVYDAKSFNLLVGNYSRVGFNHPGPAFLYVMAFGEWVFYDSLGLVRSPFSGQLLGIFLLNSLWVLYIFCLLNYYFRSVKIGILIGLFFLVFSSSFNSQFFNGMWFPHLYFLPFTVFVLSMAILQGGSIECLRSTAISMGFLINGHASFIVLVGIILLIIILININKYKNLVSINKKVISQSFLIVFFLLSPLFIETLIKFPGPLYDYYSYGKHHISNDLYSAANFVAFYWLDKLLALAAIFIGFTIFLKNIKLNNVSIRPVLIVFLLVTFALLFYAVKGIDQLNEKYTALFYFSIPSLFFSLVCVILIEKLFPKMGNIFYLSIILVMSTLFLCNLEKSPEYVSEYRNLQVPIIYKKIHEISNNRKIALELVSDETWPIVWARLVGVANYSKRNDDISFCIKTNWHILFTNDFKCTGDLGGIDEYRVTLNKVRLSEGDSNLESVLDFTKKNAFSLVEHPKISIYSDKEIFKNEILKSGWSVIEDYFVWSLGKSSKLKIMTPDGFKGNIVLDMEAYLPLESSTQSINVFSTSSVFSKVLFSRKTNRQLISIPVIGNNHEYIIEVDEPRAPSSFGTSTDQRLIGVALYGISLKAN